jgi:HflX-like protein
VDQAPVRPGNVAVSALTGEGLPDLLRAIEARLSGSMETVEYRRHASDGEQLAWLYDHGEVIGEQEMDNMIHVTVRLRPADRARFEWQTKRQEGFAASQAHHQPLEAIPCQTVCRDARVRWRSNRQCQTNTSPLKH